MCYPASSGVVWSLSRGCLSTPSTRCCSSERRSSLERSDWSREQKFGLGLRLGLDVGLEAKRLVQSLAHDCGLDFDLEAKMSGSVCLEAESLVSISVWVSRVWSRSQSRSLKSGAQFTKHLTTYHKIIVSLS